MDRAKREGVSAETSVRAGTLAAILAAALPAFADQPAAATTEPAAAVTGAPAPPPRRYARATLETMGATSIGTLWYWANTDLNQVDWELTWDWPSWRRKLLTLDAIRFDSNGFVFNSIRHPMAGTVFYQIGRANGFGPAGSLVFNLAGTLFWEYIVEFKELVSLNDLFVNTSTGVSIGEPFIQMGRYLHVHGESWPERALAYVLSPFEGLHGWEGRRWWQAREPWHRLRFSAGLRAASFGDAGSRGEGLLGMDLELVTQPGYGRPGEGDRAVAFGSWNRITLRGAFSQGAPGTPIVGSYLRTRTTMFGRYTRRFDAAGEGWGFLAGAGTAFHYETRRIGEELEQLALAHLAGPQLELAVQRDDFTVRWELAGYSDFALVQAHALGPNNPLDPSPPFPSPMRPHGYYYAFGITGETRLRVETSRWDLELELRGHQFWSIDRWKRTDEGTPDPEDVVDQRLIGRAGFDFHVGEGLGIAAVVEGTGRRGTWESIDRRTLELAGSLHLVMFR